MTHSIPKHPRARVGARFALSLLAFLAGVAAFALVLALGVAYAHVASAQGAGPFKLVAACDDHDYPNVHCDASIVDDRFGVTKPYTAGVLQFQVFDVAANKLITPTVVTPTNEKGVPLLLVIDTRSILEAPAPGTGAMMQTAKAIGNYLSLADVTPKDQLAVVVPTTTMSTLADFDERVDSIFVAAPNVMADGCPTFVQICNPLVQRVRPAPVMPIYRALDRAVNRVRGQDGARAVVLITDGRKDKINTQDLSQDLVLKRANEANVPIFVIAYGAKPNDALLRPLADLSGGQVLTAPRVDDLSDGLTRIHRRLKMQFGLNFVADTPGDNLKHNFWIGVNVQNVGEGQTKLQLTAFLPVKPVIVNTLVTTGGAAAQGLDTLLAQQPVLGRQFDISPVLQMRGQPAHIEYRLNNMLLSDKLAPLQISAKALNLSESVTHTLRIRALDADGNASDEARFDFRIEACNAVCWVNENRIRALAIAAIAAATLAVISLIGFAIARMSHARRGALLGPQSSQPVISSARHIATKPQPKTSPAPSPLASALPAATSGPSARQTAMPNGMGAFGGSVATSPARLTRILDEQPLAFLEFGSDNVSHKRVGIGGHDGKSTTFGWDMREDDPENQVRIRSDYVSRTHAEIRQQGDALYLVDLSSKSGTWLDGQRILANTPMRIQAGSKIKFADVGAIVKEA